MRHLSQILVTLMLLTVSSFSYSQCGEPVPLLCDADGDFDVDYDDIAAIGAAKGSPANSPVDIRDIDGDGIITVLDARQCVARCDEEGCADPTLGLIPAPDVVGLSQVSAESDIISAGLAVGAVSTVNSNSVPSGSVISQIPTAGVQVSPGSPVDLVVSLGSALIATPDVVGLSQGAAESDIVGAGLVVGVVTTATSGSVPAGEVISQLPTASVLVAANSSVNLVVSLGAALIPTPDVVGLSQTAAEGDITGAGLVVGNISTANSNSVPAGDVISQIPAAGVQVASGSSVDLVVSLGGNPEAPSVDANGDGVIDSLDVTLIESCESAQTTLQPECQDLDVDGNGIVDASEVSEVLARLRAATYDADVNEDGVINQSDLAFVNSCFAFDISVDDTCSPADIDGDFMIDDVDVSIVTSRLGETGLPFMRPSDTTRLIATTSGEVLANRIQVLLINPSRSDANDIAALVSGNVTGYLPSIGYFVIEFPSDLAPADIDLAVQTARSSPLVDVASVITLAEVSAFVSDLDTESDANEQTAYDLVRLRQAWTTLDALSPGLSKVGVGVVDSGLFPHSELQASRVTGDRPSDNIKSWYNRFCALPGLCDFEDAQTTHGTFVASIIAADNKDDQSSTKEFSGVAGGYLGNKLRTKVTRVESFSNSDIFNALDQAAADPFTHVVNVSLGGALCTFVGRTTNCAHPAGFFAFTRTMQILVRQYSNKLFVIAAGNDNIDVMGNPFATLNSEPNVMVVAGLDNSGQFRFGGVRGSNGQVTPGTVSIGAPFFVYAASKNILLSTDTYNYASGTSFSAPMVAAAAALAMSLDSSLKNNPSQAKSLLESTASPIPDQTAAGRRLNLCGMVEGALSIGPTTVTENFDSIQVAFDNTRPQLTRFSFEDNVNNIRYLNTRLSQFAAGLLPPSSAPNAVDQAFNRRPQGTIGQPLVVIAKDCGWTKVTFRYARAPDFFVTAYAGKLPEDLTSSFWNRLETRRGIQAQPGGLTSADLPEVAGLRLLDSQRVLSRAGGSMGTVTITAPPGEKIDFLLIGGQDSFPNAGLYTPVGIDDIVFEK